MMRFRVFEGETPGTYYWHVEHGRKVITASSEQFPTPSKAIRAVAQFWRGSVKAAHGGVLPEPMPRVPYAVGSIQPEVKQ